MARPKRNRAERETHLFIVAEMMRKCYSQREMSVATGRSLSTVNRDVKIVTKQWAKEHAEDIHILKTQALQENQYVMREAIKCFEKSKGEKVVETKKAVESSGWRNTLRKESIQVKNEQYGDPRYLQIVENGLRFKADLLGLNAPKEVEANVDHQVSGSILHTHTTLQDTLDLVEAAINGTDGGALSEVVPERPVLPDPLRITEG